MTHNHCRYCDNWRDQEFIRYATRHCAHPKCWLDRGRTLAELPWHQIERFPYFLLKERGLLDEARRLVVSKNVPESAHDKRLKKVLGAGVAAVLLATIASANAQGVSSCLADAASEYKRAYASHCPGGLNYPCVLRPLADSRAKSDWASARSRCFEDHSAAALDRADDMQRKRETR